MNNETPVRPETPSRENRGLDALFSPKNSKKTDAVENVPKESIQEPQQPSLLSKVGQGLKNLVTSSETEKIDQVQRTGTQTRSNTKSIQNVAAAKMLQGVQAAAGELLQPDGTTEESLIVEAGSAALQEQAVGIQQQQQQASFLQQQQAQQQIMIEERKKKQAEMDRRKRLRMASLQEDSLAKSVIKDQLNPLDVGLMSTPFGILWGPKILPKLGRMIGKLFP